MSAESALLFTRIDLKETQKQLAKVTAELTKKLAEETEALKALAESTAELQDMARAEGIEEGKKMASSLDTARMNYLVSKVVFVREPLLYGSSELFISQRIGDEEDAEYVTDLRQAIDAAMLAAAPTPEKEE